MIYCLITYFSTQSQRFASLPICKYPVSFLWHCGPARAMASPFLTLLGHTHWTHRRRYELSARRRDLITHNAQNRQTTMHLAGFEAKVSAGKRPQTDALKRAAISTGLSKHNFFKFSLLISTRGFSYLNCLGNYWLVISPGVQNLFQDMHSDSR